MSRIHRSRCSQTVDRVEEEIHLIVVSEQTMLGLELVLRRSKDSVGSFGERVHERLSEFRIGEEDSETQFACEEELRQADLAVPDNFFLDVRE